MEIVWPGWQLETFRVLPVGSGPERWTGMDMVVQPIRGLERTLALIERSTSRRIVSVCFQRHPLTISVEIEGVSTPITWSW